MSNFSIDLEKQLSKLGRDIQQLVERAVPVQGASNFQPKCDVVESEKQFSLILDLPGMKKEQISITMKNGVITVSGDRELFLEDHEKLVRSERKQGSFSRAFALPEGADPKSVQAEFNDGVLRITVSKTVSEEDGDSQSIPIN
ncbi:Hsp20/alpha crystallin family protein [Rhodohalobacter halophilus]|uniref:Hsp20/alpha crystallin family protein n=1 Tax=Rhodohalobacter halophilus TaxID=1812810 RepID=UPI00083F7483|nr:Hsp20/alpha crystallin family protein [Rhodohalobacter halophilus]